jgi:hypothetical protein
MHFPKHHAQKRASTKGVLPRENKLNKIMMGAIIPVRGPMATKVRMNLDKQHILLGKVTSRDASEKNSSPSGMVPEFVSQGAKAAIQNL